jgi:hypothetical protein
LADLALAAGLKPMTASVKRRAASRVLGSPVRAASFESWSITRGSMLSLYNCLAGDGFSFNLVNPPEFELTLLEGFSRGSKPAPTLPVKER